ncbi:MAG: diguanylate cyclase, partial [Deltaproteobacteria bacterium]|nr:diguanylate cyclase [Deltaproteobacteria bacterium]
QALDEGADDFIPKPFDEVELLARVKAQLRIKSLYDTVERDKRDLTTILEITRTASSTLDSSKILYYIVKKVAEITDAARCSIILIGEKDAGYVLASNDDPAIKDLKIDLQRYPEIKRVLSTGRPVIVDDMAEDPLLTPVRNLIMPLKGMSILVLPITWGEEILGTLFLRSRRVNRSFTKGEIDLCEVIANSCSRALRNARMYEHIKNERDRLKDMAITDQLTGTYNHTHFYTRLNEEFDKAVRYQFPFSLIMLDIDDFKRINDTYGHRKGDYILKEVANAIKKAIRKGDILARYGGDEFIILLSNTLLQGALEQAERIRQMVRNHNYNYKGIVEEDISISLGVSSLPHEMVKEPGDLVNLADKALYESKKSEVNKVTTLQTTLLDRPL